MQFPAGLLHCSRIMRIRGVPTRLCNGTKLAHHGPPRAAHLAECKLGLGRKKINQDKWVSIHHLYNKYLLYWVPSTGLGLSESTGWFIFVEPTPWWDYSQTTFDVNRTLGGPWCASFVPLHNLVGTPRILIILLQCNKPAGNCIPWDFYGDYGEFRAAACGSE